MKAHCKDLPVRGQTKGYRRPAGFTLKRSRVRDAVPHELNQPVDLVLSDPLHPFPPQLASLFALRGAHYRTGPLTPQSLCGRLNALTKDIGAPPPSWGGVVAATTGAACQLRARPGAGGRGCADRLQGWRRR